MMPATRRIPGRGALALRRFGFGSIAVRSAASPGDNCAAGLLKAWRAAASMPNSLRPGHSYRFWAVCWVKVEAPLASVTSSASSSAA